MKKKIDNTKEIVALKQNMWLFYFLSIFIGILDLLLGFVFFTLGHFGWQDCVGLGVLGLLAVIVFMGAEKMRGKLARLSVPDKKSDSLR